VEGGGSCIEFAISINLNNVGIKMYRVAEFECCVVRAKVKCVGWNWEDRESRFKKTEIQTNQL